MVKKTTVNIYDIVNHQDESYHLDQIVYLARGMSGFVTATTNAEEQGNSNDVNDTNNNANNSSSILPT